MMPAMAPGPVVGEDYIDYFARVNRWRDALGIPEQAAIRPPDITMATALRQPRRLFVCFPMSPLLARPPTRKKAVLDPV